MWVTVSSGGSRLRAGAPARRSRPGQVPLDPLQAAGAEDAAHPAADLRADADRPPVAPRPSARTRSAGRRGTPAAACRSRRATIVINGLRAEDIHSASSRLPQRNGQVGHRVERLGPAADDPVDHLPARYAGWPCSAIQSPQIIRGCFQEQPFGYTGRLRRLMIIDIQYEAFRPRFPFQPAPRVA